MSKLNRERKLQERRMDKEARKDARRRSPEEYVAARVAQAPGVDEQEPGEA